MSTRYDRLDRGTIAMIAFFVFLIVVMLSGCASGNLRTELGNDVESACIESRAAYNGHRLACIVTDCPASEIAQAKSVQAQAKALCERNSPADIPRIKALVEAQRKVGR